MHLNICCVLLISFLWINSVTSQEYSGCDHYKNVEPNKEYVFASPRYPQSVRSKNCRWFYEAPFGYRLSILCQVDVSWSPNCRLDHVVISPTGRMDLGDGTRNCGKVNVTGLSQSRRISIALFISYFSFGGKFKCTLKTAVDHCKCGQRNTGKIVGGNETLINEFPMMAGLVDANTMDLMCGASIISRNYVLTASHCLTGLSPNSLEVLVGDHDLVLANETNKNKTYKIKRFINHPKYDEETNVNDISLIEVAKSFTFNYAVMPVCLPFRYMEDTMIGTQVIITGFGSTEFGGPKSDVLRKVELNVVESETCSASQTCTYGFEKDSCQFDSGGPVMHIADGTTVYIWGIVSFGIGCGGLDPSVNTKVTSYLDWIIENTANNIYCVK